MNSRFLNNLGMGNVDFGIVIFVMAVLLLISIIVLIVTTVKLCKLRKRFEKFSQGRNAKSLEEEIGTMFEQNKAIKDQTDKNKRDIKFIYKVLESTFQKIGLIRYDAFSQMGGKFSFSLALLNEKNDGFIITSVHANEGCYTYSKEITKGECDTTLGPEEQQALDKAMGKG
jgi:hypothetical protein